MPCKTWHEAVPIGFRLCAPHDPDRTLVTLAYDNQVLAAWGSRWPTLWGDSVMRIVLMTHLAW